MAQRIPITVLLKSKKERALIDEVAHRLDQSRSAFCREAILQAVVDYTDEIQGNEEPETREAQT